MIERSQCALAPTIDGLTIAGESREIHELLNQAWRDFQTEKLWWDSSTPSHL